MLRTIWECDCCNKSQDENKPPMFKVAVCFQDTCERHYPSRTIESYPKKEALWCEECIARHGLKFIKSVAPPVPPPTIEEILREIMRDEIQEAKE